MLEKVGENAGLVWNALNENGQLGLKELKKATKIKTDKELYLALGWLMREEKIQVEGTEKEPEFSLK